MMNPSLIIIICLEVLLFLLLSSQDISSRDTYGLSYCLFSAFFLISVFRRMGDCKWLIGFDAYCSRDIKFTHTFLSPSHYLFSFTNSHIQ